MNEKRFEPSEALGAELANLSRQELCELAITLCGIVSEEAGENAYRGGIYPENISRTEDGTLVIGPGKLSDWDGPELQYIAPELYWDGECGPESDVYSLGLLLWYGLSGAKLPFEGESPDAQLSRMSGEAIAAPVGVGVRLGEIVQKACAFKASDRYPTAAKLRVMLESCLENKYFASETGAELFKKEEKELSEAERMMLAILNGEPTEPKTDVADSGETEPVPVLSREKAEELILSVHAPEKAEEPDREAEMKALVEEVFGEPEKEKEPETTAAPIPPAEQEDVRVYQPGGEKKEKNRSPIPILTEEKNPELAPVVLAKKPRVRYSEDEERNRQITENVKRRRTRPIGVVLILCGLLILAALVVNHFLQNYEWEDEGRGKSVTMPEVGENAIDTNQNFVTAEELERQQREAEAAARPSYYQVIAGDITWTAAKNACSKLEGGQLAVIRNADEFMMATQLAQNAGLQGVWVGCHREGNILVWETTESVGSMSWAQNEPSYIDSRDGAAEDYIMLWNTGDGWAYIDCRNDPVWADPNLYAGKIGYVCQIVG